MMKKEIPYHKHRISGTQDLPIWLVGFLGCCIILIVWNMYLTIEIIKLKAPSQVAPYKYTLEDLGLTTECVYETVEKYDFVTEYCGSIEGGCGQGILTFGISYAKISNDISRVDYHCKDGYKSVYCLEHTLKPQLYVHNESVCTKQYVVRK